MHKYVYIISIDFFLLVLSTCSKLIVNFNQLYWPFDRQSKTSEQKKKNANNRQKMLSSSRENETKSLKNDMFSKTKTFFLIS